MQQYAKAYAAAGMPVFPCTPRDKKPACSHGCLDATTDVDMICEWWGKNPDFNIGMSTTGLCVVDIDDEPNWQAFLTAQGQAEATTLNQRTGRGRQLLFRQNGRQVRNSQNRLCDGVDVRGDGGYIVAAPSVHPNGKTYTWLDANGQPGDFDPARIAALPAWIEGMLCSPATAQVTAPAVAQTPRQHPTSGTRHNHLLTLALTMRRRGCSQETIRAAVMAENMLFTKGPKPPVEVERILSYDPASHEGLAGEDAEIDELKIFRPNPHNAPAASPALINFNNVPILNPGEIVGIVALAGTGKSSVTGGIVAAMLGPICDSLGFQVYAKSFLFVDTEQGHYHCWQDWNRALRRAGVTDAAAVQWENISLMETLAERQAYLWRIFDRPDVPEIIILDGIADFIGDVNSTEETAALVYRLIAKGKAHNIGIVVTIHQNPQGGSEKGRGNLGSEIWRKAQAMFCIKRDATDKSVRELTTAFSLGKVRGAPDQLSTYFRWSDADGMFISCSKPETKGKTATENDKLLELMKNDAWDYSTLKKKFAALLEKSIKTGERRIESLTELGLIEKLPDERYRVKKAESGEKDEAYYQK